MQAEEEGSLEEEGEGEEEEQEREQEQRSQPISSPRTPSAAAGHAPGPWPSPWGSFGGPAEASPAVGWPSSSSSAGPPAPPPSPVRWVAVPPPPRFSTVALVPAPPPRPPSPWAAVLRPPAAAPASPSQWGYSGGWGGGLSTGQAYPGLLYPQQHPAPPGLLHTSLDATAGWQPQGYFFPPLAPAMPGPNAYYATPPQLAAWEGGGAQQPSRQPLLWPAAPQGGGPSESWKAEIDELLSTLRGEPEVASQY